MTPGNPAWPLAAGDDPKPNHDASAWTMLSSCCLVLGCKADSAILIESVFSQLKNKKCYNWNQALAFSHVWSSLFTSLLKEDKVNHQIVNDVINVCVFSFFPFCLLMTLLQLLCGTGYTEVQTCSGCGASGKTQKSLSVLPGLGSDRGSTSLIYFIYLTRLNFRAGPASFSCIPLFEPPSGASCAFSPLFSLQKFWEAVSKFLMLILSHKTLQHY